MNNKKIATVLGCLCLLLLLPHTAFGGKVLTIYFLGTGETPDWSEEGSSDFYHPELVASLYKYDQSESDFRVEDAPRYKSIVNGIGTGPPSSLASVAFPDAEFDGARGWTACLTDAVDDLWAVLKNLSGAQLTLNLVGYSRGGILTMKMARLVENSFRHYDIAINILAYEPVPGISPDHLEGTVAKLGDDIVLPDRVKRYVGIYAADERSFQFEPVIPKLKTATQRWLVRLRGAHETVVGSQQVDGHAISTYPLPSDVPGFETRPELYDVSLASIGNISKAIGQELLSSPGWGSIDFDPELNWYLPGDKKVQLMAYIDQMNSYTKYSKMRSQAYTFWGWSAYDKLLYPLYKEKLSLSTLIPPSHGRLCYRAPRRSDRFLIPNHNLVFWLKNYVSSIDKNTAWEKIEELGWGGLPRPVANAGEDLVITADEQSDTTLLGHASIYSDPNNEIIRYRWYHGSTPLSDWETPEPDGTASLDLGGSQVPLFNHVGSDYTLSIEVQYKDMSIYDQMVLSVVNKPEVWVDDDFTSATPGWGVTHFNRIQSAVHRVQPTLRSPGIVHVAAGTYVEHVLLNKNIHLLGEGADVVTIDGSGAPYNGVFGIYQGGIHSISPGEETFLVIDGVKIINGSGFIPAGDDGNSRGGGIYLEHVEQGLIRNCHIIGNSSYSGGGIYSYESNVHLYNCIVENNSAAGEFGSGGGMYNTYSSTLVEESAFINNSAQERGGGFFNYTAVGYPMVINSRFENNTAKYGGGAATGGSDTFTGCVFEANQARYGGGMFVSSGSPVVKECRFIKNDADSGGGGMHIAGGASPRIEQSLFQENDQWNGAAVSIVGSSRPLFINSIFTNNDRHALFIDSNSRPNFVNCTVYGSVGCGVYLNSGVIRFKNSILWENTFADIHVGRGSASVANSNIEDSGSWSGVNDNISALPMFNDANAGDFSLQSTSPCIDKGDNAILPDGTYVDFYGQPRIMPIGRAVDIGAAESAFCHNPCDFSDSDGDVDGVDLSAWANDPSLIDLQTLSDNFGKIDCLDD